LKTPKPGHSQTEEKCREDLDRDPEKFGVTGWYKRGLGGDRMKSLAAELEEREAARIKNNPKIGKEESGMSVSWTPERKENFLATLAAKRRAKASSSGPLDPEIEKGEKTKEKPVRRRPSASALRARDYRERKKRALAGVGALPATHLKELPGNGASPATHPDEAKACLSIFCMRCGFPMQIEDPGSFATKR
jgi:hypothetical protein